MKTQLSKPARSKARYTERGQKAALKSRRNSGRSAAKVAAELGIRVPLLRSLGSAQSAKSIFQAMSPSQAQRRELEAEIRRLRAENAKLLEQREVLKKSLGILSEAPPRSMPDRTSDRPIYAAWLCETLLVSRSGYYAWIKRRCFPDPRQLENIRLRQRIRGVHVQSQTYGSPRLAQVLGCPVGVIASAGSCAWKRIFARQRSKYRPMTTTVDMVDPSLPTGCALLWCDGLPGLGH